MDEIILRENLASTTPPSDCEYLLEVPPRYRKSICHLDADKADTEGQE